MIPNRFAAQVAGPNNPDAETSRQNPQRDIPRRLRTTDMPRGTARNPRTLKSDFSDIQCRLFWHPHKMGMPKILRLLLRAHLPSSRPVRRTHQSFSDRMNRESVTFWDFNFVFFILCFIAMMHALPSVNSPFPIFSMTNFS